MTPEQKYRKSIEQILLHMAYDTRSSSIPEWFVIAVANIINEHDITIITNEPERALAITTEV